MVKCHPLLEVQQDSYPREKLTKIFIKAKMCCGSQCVQYFIKNQVICVKCIHQGVVKTTAGERGLVAVQNHILRNSIRNRPAFSTGLPQVRICWFYCNHLFRAMRYLRTMFDFLKQTWEKADGRTHVSDETTEMCLNDFVPKD